MKEYQITYTAFPIGEKYHFSGCRAKIKGENLKDAIDKFAKEQREKGFIIGYVVEGDMFKIAFYDKEVYSDMINTIHDCCFDVSGISLTDEDVRLFLTKIPEDIEKLADQWGWSDTEVRDKVYVWMKEMLG